ncbi:MAG: hypothetical protein II884_07495 [Synergistaceae bacterium]|nr:hypothetical protein [Synergistaceae bacterium]
MICTIRTGNEKRCYDWFKGVQIKIVSFAQICTIIRTGNEKRCYDWFKGVQIKIVSFAQHLKRGKENGLAANKPVK